MLQYHVLLCDADDTLFDFAAAERGAFRAALSGTPYAGRAGTLATGFSRINQALWQRAAQGEVDQAYIMRHRFAELARECGLEIDPIAVNQAFLQGLAEQPVLFEGALEAVREWAGLVRIAIVTNGVTTVQHKRLNLSPIAPYIRLLLTSQEVGEAKPHPAMLHRAMDGLGESDLSRVLMLGDSLSTDIAAARAAGIDSCLYAPGEASALEGCQPAYVAHSYEQVTAILRGEGAKTISAAKQGEPTNL